MKRIWLPVFLLCLYASPAFGCDEGIFTPDEVHRFFGHIAIAFAVANMLIGLDSFARFGCDSRITLNIAPEASARATAHFMWGGLLIGVAFLVPEYGFITVMASVPFHLYMAYLNNKNRAPALSILSIFLITLFWFA